MNRSARCRILALIGSGETSPTMVTVHRELVARLDVTRPHALLLATPYAFQENAAGVSAKAQGYFSRSVGLEVTVAAGTGAARNGSGGDAGLTAVRSADWVFAGPGSPSYALTHWRDGPVAAALQDRVSGRDGVTVLASAAAATAGYAALPVYEIYKAGTTPHWLPGLDLLAALGLRAAVIPHYDNTEGQGYDTRYCYLGERRLALLEQELDADAAVLGVDEHTAAIIDVHAGTMRVTGHGGVTVRRSGVSTVLPSGTYVTVTELRDLLRGSTTRPPPTRPAALQAEADPAPAAMPDLIVAAERGFDAAAARRDARGMVQAILELETAIGDWDSDTDEDQGTGQARAVLHSLITRLGQAAQAGLTDPRDQLLPAVEPLLTLRATLRREGRYLAADNIRDALATAGIHIQDTSDGTQWNHHLPPA